MRLHSSLLFDLSEDPDTKEKFLLLLNVAYEAARQGKIFPYAEEIINNAADIKAVVAAEDNLLACADGKIPVLDCPVAIALLGDVSITWPHLRHQLVRMVFFCRWALPKIIACKAAIQRCYEQAAENIIVDFQSLKSSYTGRNSLATFSLQEGFCVIDYRHLDTDVLLYDFRIEQRSHGGNAVTRISLSDQREISIPTGVDVVRFITHRFGKHGNAAFENVAHVKPLERLPLNHTLLPIIENCLRAHFKSSEETK